MAGMLCLKCGGKTGVFFSEYQSGVFCRRRWCVDEKCNERFSTYEVEKTFFNRLVRRATVRFVAEGNHLLEVVDLKLTPQKDIKKIERKIARFKASEEKRLAQHQARKSHERLDSEGIKNLLKKS